MQPGTGHTSMQRLQPTHFSSMISGTLAVAPFVFTRRIDWWAPSSQAT